MTLSKDLTEALLQTQEKLLAALAEVTRLRAALLKVYECDGCRHCSDLTGTALDALAAGRGWTRSRTVTELVDAARRHDDGQR